MPRAPEDDGEGDDAYETATEGLEFDDSTSGSDGARTPREALPDDLDAGDDDDGLAVTDPTDVDEVDVSNIKTPRPITRTIAARSLKRSAHPDEVRRKELPSRKDCEQCDDTNDDGDDSDESEDEECEHTANQDGVPFSQATAYRRRLTDAIDYDYTPDDDDEDGEKERVSLYGRVVQRFETTDGLETHLSVRLADKTGVVDVELHPKMDPLDDFTASDEILVTECLRTDDDDDDEGAFTVTADSALIRVAENDSPVGELLKEQTALTKTPRKFRRMEYKTEAVNWVADVIVDEWTVETPRDGDEMFVYVDDPDSEQYGTFAGEGETRLKEIIDQYLPPRHCNQRNKGEIVNLVRDRTYVPSDTFRGGEPDSEARRWSVAVQNGVIDLRTGELYEHDPAWRCREKLPVEYDPSKDGLGDEWEWFVDDVTDTDADREVLMYAAGHAIARCYPEEAVFCLIGPGKNGKSVWHKAIKQLFAPVAGDFEFKTITGDSEFGTRALKGNHLIVDDDATDVKAQDLSVLKRHSGGASGEINIKDVKRHSYDNYATFVILTNDPPVLGDLSDGAKRRMYPSILPHRYTNDPTDDNKDAVPEEELIDRLTSDEELEGLLAAAVEYAQNLYRDGEIQDGRTEDERWELYEEYSDSVLRFWDECAVQETGSRVPRSVIYETYVQWCDRQGIDALSPGGSNGFWGLSDSCHAVSYKRDGIYTDGERAVEHVMINEAALKYAPKWVADSWGADVAEDESTLANRLDRVTPIADLNKGYSTTEGTVIGRDLIDTNDATGVRLTIEDTTHAIDVIEWVDDVDDAVTDGVDVGDTLRLKRAVLTSNKGVPQLQLRNTTEITVSKSGVFEDEDDRHVEDTGDDDDDGEDADSDDELPQEDRITELKNVIGAEQNRTDVTGVSVDTVLDAAADRGIDRGTVEHDLETLRHQGDVYEPADGRVVLVGGDE